MRSSILLALLLAPAAAHAGMPNIYLNDVASLRIEAISFFLFLVVGAALGARALWNFLRRDFPRLPRLTVKAAFALVLLWGLAFYVVLAMIAGSRELMTPGAWESDGVVKRLKVPRAAPLEAQLAAAREAQLARLRAALWAYAAAHEGRLPPHDLDPAIPEVTWRTIDPSGMHYAYVPGAVPDKDARVVAYEPGIFGRKRYVLRANGEIALADFETFRAEVPR